ncbi:hypothetical protein F511_36651 [Dorcoceras hygrometricum]|uniref:Uncharacterized protein n=1 Tax=Dorcoceras hygrometricum TaxID=472368 RepID=A0A2Z7BBN9_9LAMI|nr:hypothetical protein F511_36651 [Dorcoceras hygrometricum]
MSRARKVQRYHRSGATGFECLPPSCDGLTGPDDHGPMISTGLLAVHDSSQGTSELSLCNQLYPGFLNHVRSYPEPQIQKLTSTEERSGQISRTSSNEQMLRSFSPTSVQTTQQISVERATQKEPSATNLVPNGGGKRREIGEIGYGEQYRTRVSKMRIRDIGSKIR